MLALPLSSQLVNHVQMGLHKYFDSYAFSMLHANKDKYIRLPWHKSGFVTTSKILNYFSVTSMEYASPDYNFLIVNNNKFLSR